MSALVTPCCGAEYDLDGVDDHGGRRLCLECGRVCGADDLVPADGVPAELHGELVPDGTYGGARDAGSLEP